MCDKTAQEVTCCSMHKSKLKNVNHRLINRKYTRIIARIILLEAASYIADLVAQGNVTAIDGL